MQPFSSGLRSSVSSSHTSPIPLQAAPVASSPRVDTRTATSGADALRQELANVAGPVSTTGNTSTDIYIDIASIAKATRSAAPKAAIASDTPLMLAAADGDTANVLALLSAGAQVDQVRTDGATALMAAAQDGHTDTVLVLLQAGAGVGQADCTGWTRQRQTVGLC